ncbi:N-acetylglucosamine kinase [Photobacterium carnosum]|uniref:N-acetyl-D-glucosamine kinase n=1 Tax=Photobacterium carnosum TaxID=2023717 RepID=A0A2N4UTM0_9GAMM|nr:N-acetylglucosamine kinase [Photobacterium carnosum]KAE8178348.1 N-acetylglucosamine kinase [Photobacterium carnosum]MBY3790303.1 N-acetylglucosamine kinase [Photobacterium carnosum]MCD9496082.1 N-acetylglucosamine kinase [Photobacterium carnosum]MCD9498521.1 N-acetylglucosamine kinase [Photobacterium carnosum]MCD9514518.1 N-acetylglucosamine kinase [Photobacterium carnosum]
MYYGFDVGGTKIEFGAFNEKLERVATERVPTPSNDYDKLIDTIVSIITAADIKFGCEGSVGLGIPGIEDARDGTVLTSNIPSAKGKTLRKDLEAKLGRSVSLDNDANCFALSEAWDDEHKDAPSVLGLILGTGFGGGMIFNGKVFAGLNHVGGELGHMRLPLDAWLYMGEQAPLFDCGCGQKGCMDNYLSGRGFEQIYAHYYGEKLKAIEIIERNAAGDKKAQQHVDRFMEVLAMCLANLFTGIDPHVVVLGGGLSNFELIYDELPKRLPKYLLSVSQAPKIVKAKHGDAGGVRGAAFLNIKQ